MTTLVVTGGSRAADGPLLVYSAGSLRDVVGALGDAWVRRGGPPLAATFGASGLLRDRLLGGEPADLFLSANVEHPQALATAGRAGPIVLFARNRLCALARPEVGVTRENLLERMLVPKVKLGTSTPRADPSGDYAWEVFAKAEALRPGARAVLEAKALKLTGGPASPPPPADRSVYAMLVERGEADVFLTYCTNARAAQAEVPRLAVIDLPPALATGADYGMAVVLPARSEASAFALFIMSLEGQRILADRGFTAVARPEGGSPQ